MTKHIFYITTALICFAAFIAAVMIARGAG